MDPQATLAQALEALADGCFVSASDRFEALANWINNGGFSPDLAGLNFGTKRRLYLSLHHLCQMQRFGTAALIYLHESACSTRCSPTWPRTRP